MYLTDFNVVRPRYEKSQKSLLQWLVKAHTRSRGRLNGWVESSEEARAFSQKLEEKLMKIGLGEDKIQKRGFYLDDHTHENWDEMAIYHKEEPPEGQLLDKRLKIFGAAAKEAFETIYPTPDTLPKHLIHTTCTGYLAPSPAQSHVSELDGDTVVTHAYHMGCYGSVPSVRMAMGHQAAANESSDIVHTEFCSLHMNPTLHSSEQLVVQSLFADGVIKYTLKGEASSPSLKLLTIHEEMIPHSTGKMTWVPNPWGFYMTISKDIPVLIRKNIEGYLERMAKKVRVKNFAGATFAIHPGGTKIVDQVAEKLKLDHNQIHHTKEVLRNYGNMSSATLPHVWERVVNDDSICQGELVVSMAFGPGLSIAGAVFEKR